MSALSPVASHSEPELESSPPFKPSPKDVLSIKTLLLRKLGLPIEIIDVIIDWAEYWPCSTVTTKVQTLATGSDRSRADKLVLRSLPLGYYSNGNDNLFALPIIDYLAAQPEPCSVSDSSTSQAKIDDLLKKWKATSLPRSKQPCRKIVFTIKSHDQGWASEPAIYQKTYQRSWTWFDVGLEQLDISDAETNTSLTSVPQIRIPQLHSRSKDDTSEATNYLICNIRTIQPLVIRNPSDPLDFTFDHPFFGTEARLQTNLMAQRQAKEHSITWAYDDCISSSSTEGDALEEGGRGRATGNGEFIRNLKLGDIVTIWARARFPGWQNHVEEARIDVYWVV